MSAGVAGTVVVDIDANIDAYSRKLATARADAEQLVRTLEGKPAKIDVDTAAAQKNLNAVDTAAQKAASSVTSSSSKMSKAFGGFTDALSPVPLTMAGIGAGAVLAGKALIGMAQAAADDAASVARLEQAVVNAEGSMSGYQAAIDAAVKSGQAMAFSDDQTREALTTLISLTGSAEEGLRRLSVAQDLSRGAGIELATAARLLGKVSDENTSALGRYGIAVSETATAQDVLNTVDAKFGGQAGKFAETDAAKFARAADAIDELKEAIGAKLIPIFVTMSSDIVTITEQLGGMERGLLDVAQAAGVSGDAADGWRDKWKDAIIGTGEDIRGQGVDLAEGAIGITKFFIPAIDKIRDAEGLLAKAVIVATTEVATQGTTFTTGTAAVDAYARAIEAQTRAQHGGISASTQYADSLGRQAEYAGLANERNLQYAQGLELASGAAARAAYVTAQLGNAQASLAGAYQVGLEAQGAFNSQSSEYSSQIQTIKDGVDQWEKELANGNITQEQFNQKQELATQAIARYEGGIADATTTAADFAIANGQIMQIQDRLVEQYPDLVQGSDEYNQKMRELAQEAGLSEEAVAGVLGGSENLTGTIANELVPAILDLISRLGELAGIDATPEVSLDNEPFKNGVAEVEGDVITLNALAPKPSVGLDTSEFDTNLGTATDAIDSFMSGGGGGGAAGPGGTGGASGGGYSASLTADNTDALEKSQDAREDMRETADGTYIATVTANTAEALSNVNTLRGNLSSIPPSFTITANVDISGALAAINTLNANIPHSPAKEGPFKELPTWEGVFEQLGASAEKYTDEALDHIKKFVDTANAAYGAYSAGLDIGAKLAEGFALPSPDQLALLDAATLHAIQSITDSARQFRTTGLDKAKEYADAGRAIFDMLSSGIEAFNALATFTRPSAESISEFKFATEHLFTSIRDSALFVGDGVDEAKAYADSSNTILDMLSTGLEAFAKLEDFTRPSNDALSEFKFATEHLFVSIRDSALYVTEGIPEAQAYASAANQILEMLGAGLEAFALLEDFVRPSDADLSEFKFATEHLVQSIADTALFLNADGVQAARTYAEAAGPILDLLAAGVEGFAALAELDTTDSDVRRGVAAIASLTRVAIAAMQQAATGMSTEGLTAASDYANAADSTLGLLTSGVEAFASLDDLVASTDVRAGVAAIVALSEEAVSAIIDAAQGMTTDGLESAEAYADAGGSVLGLITSGVDALAALGDAKFSAKVNKGVDKLLAITDMAIHKVAAAAAKMDTDAIESAQQYADAAGSVVDLLSIGKDQFDGLGEFGPAIKKNIDSFVDGVTLAVDKLAQLADDLGGGLTDAVAIAHDIAEIVDLLSIGGSSSGGGTGGAGGSGGGGGFGGGGRHGRAPYAPIPQLTTGASGGSFVNENVIYVQMDSNDIARHTSRQTLAQLSGQLSAGVRG